MKCSVEGCGNEVKQKNMCSKHYTRLYRHGDVNYEWRRSNGMGSIRKDGYVQTFHDGKDQLEHKAVVEKALGKPLPKGSVIHHIDGNRLNNSSNNLVVCQSHGYHSMLHRRMRAFKATGNANNRFCECCKKYDELKNLKKGTGSTYYHNSCKVAYNKQRRNDAIIQL